MGKLAKDETLQETNSLLRILIREDLDITDYATIQTIVREGKAKEYFKIGDQINVPWKDTANNQEYTIPFDIVHFGKATLEDGSEVDGMYLQSHYAMPFGVQFSQNEAFWYCEEELVAGTYYFTCANGWGSNIVSGKSYSFTLTQNVPVGGQLQIGLANSEIGACPDKSPSDWRVRVYPNKTTVTPTEILTLTEGENGTKLGDWSSSTKTGTSGMNNMQRSSYGYNRWSKSALRQFLNSAESKENWWSTDIVFGRPPVELATKNGFLTGFTDGFLDILGKTKITTALNTACDSVIGTTEDTYDTFFLASKTNEFLTEQYTEGVAWDYWKEVNGGIKPVDYVAGSAPITYALENHTSAQYVRLRSATRGYSYLTWIVYSTGTVNLSNATTPGRFAPACVIC